MDPITGLYGDSKTGRYEKGTPISPHVKRDADGNVKDPKMKSGNGHKKR